MIDKQISIRLGTVLRLVREEMLGVSLKKLDDTLKSFGWQFPISSAAWSTYELGNRIIRYSPEDKPQEDRPLKLTSAIVDLLDKNFMSMTTDQKNTLARLIYSTFFKETLLMNLADTFPLGHAGTLILSAYIKKSAHPIPVSRPIGTPIKYELLNQWLSGSPALLDNYADWLVKTNRFTSRKTMGLYCSIQKGERFLRTPLNPKKYMSFSDTDHFMDMSTGEGLYFQHLGPALDSIITFSTGFCISHDFSSLDISVIGVENPVTVNAYWLEDADRIFNIK